MPLDYESVAAAGSILGSASVIVMDDSIDMVWAAGKVMHFFRHESCGKCTPCREGTFWMEKQYDRILGGKATLADVQTAAGSGESDRRQVSVPAGRICHQPGAVELQAFSGRVRGARDGCEEAARKSRGGANPRRLNQRQRRPLATG